MTFSILVDGFKACITTIQNLVSDVFANEAILFFIFIPFAIGFLGLLFSIFRKS